ncbi:hypothetical protein CEF21_21085 [Bacillus sp. FJAT-42376]|uniref:hypothetical protein n=1 Tax=Bacillus sp. FJAT-42376 TaxID=2014076 RepID=UPI000F4D853E|nr:hypothetical protein [Bacillus sp. FJAT-42376]AZB44578.1 hypothetical protein CEF21_21085 [Bacillus sp. FJAT-42376]
MKTIKLSIDELLFCLYSEGDFEQGLNFKNIYFPNIEDEDFDLMLKVACRSLLAKDLLNYSGNKYTVKKEYSSYIKTVSHAKYSLRASKVTETEDIGVSYNFGNESIHSHQMIHDQLVNKLTLFESEEEMLRDVEHFMDINSSVEMDYFRLLGNKDEFEKLLKIASNETIDKFEIDQTDDLFNEFIQDLKTKKGKLDSLAFFEYSAGNVPNLFDLIFVLKGANMHWFIDGMIENQFQLRSYNSELLHSKVFRTNTTLSI